MHCIDMNTKVVRPQFDEVVSKCLLHLAAKVLAFLQETKPNYLECLMCIEILQIRHEIKCAFHPLRCLPYYRSIRPFRREFSADGHLAINLTITSNLSFPKGKSVVAYYFSLVLTSLSSFLLFFTSITWFRRQSLRKI